MSLKELAKAVVEASAQSGDLAAAIKALAEELRSLEQLAQAHEETINTARRIYCESCDDDIELDNEPIISEADDGVWVAAWVWVSIEEKQRPSWLEGSDDFIPDEDDEPYAPAPDDDSLVPDLFL